MKIGVSTEVRKTKAKFQARKRAKISRDRKRNYIESLEMKIKDLEKENFRLQNLLIAYRKEKMDNQAKVSKKFTEDINDYKYTLMQNSVNFETMEVKENSSGGILKNYRKASLKVINKHKKFLDGLFEKLINHPYPGTRYSYWSDIPENYNTSYETIRQFTQMKKYEKEEFIKSGQFTSVDRVVASLEPDEERFEFIKNVMIKKDFELKKKYKEGIRHLLKAKSIFEATTVELFALSSWIVLGKMIPEQNWLKSKIEDGYFSNVDAFTNLWQIEVTPKEISYDLTQDPIFGKIAEENLPEEDQKISFEYNEFMLPGERAN